MKINARLFAVSVLALALAGCDIGARDVDYNPQRSISSDIAASRDHGPTTMSPGMVSSEEPEGAMPWEIGNSRQ